jgi:hypothetical protein
VFAYIPPGSGKGEDRRFQGALVSQDLRCTSFERVEIVPPIVLIPLAEREQLWDVRYQGHFLKLIIEFGN